MLFKHDVLSKVCGCKKTEWSAKRNC